MHYVWILCVLTICVGWQLVSSDPSLFHFMTFLLDWVILWGLAKWLNCLINIFHPSPNFWLSHPTCFYYLERDKKEHIWKLDLVQKEQVILEEEKKQLKKVVTLYQIFCFNVLPVTHFLSLNVFLRALLSVLLKKYTSFGRESLQNSRKHLIFWQSEKLAFKRFRLMYTLFVQDHYGNVVEWLLYII